jgi:hypothetical protein
VDLKDAQIVHHAFRAIRDAAVRWRPAQTSSRAHPTSKAMPIIHEMLRSGGMDRRSIGRTRINRSALMLFSGQSGVVSCTVRDVTNGGAGIRLDAINLLPVDFDLSFDNFRTIQKCRLVWRDCDFIGVTLD